jgi:hypothetical protein
MAFVENLTGFPIWKLTRPSKLIFGLCLMLSGSALAAQNLLAG